MNTPTRHHPAVSVIMPVYNAASTLQRAADSVLGQTFSDWELILVDDGSTDDSPALADAYAAAHPDRIRAIHKENGGLMRAWLDGMRAGTGDFLCFLDSDDWIDDKMLADLAGRLARTEDGTAAEEAAGGPDKAAREDRAERRFAPGQIVCCGYRIEYPGGVTRDVGHGLPEGVYEGARLRDELQAELLGHEQRRVILSRCMKLISRELMENNTDTLDPAIRLGEDVNIILPALLDARRVVLTQTPFYHYTYVPDSMVHRYDAGLYDDIRRLRAQLRLILEKKNRAAGRGDAAAGQVTGPVLSPDAADREFALLFLQVVKNEVRRTDGKAAAAEAVRRIQALCRAENSRALIAGLPEKLHDPANRLLAAVCRHPSALRIRAVRAVFLLYERRRG